MFTPAEILAPGSGLCAVIVCVPACALVAVPAAVSCVDETYVVVSAVVPRYPTAPCAKCNPVSVIVNGPWAMLIGDRKSTRLNSSHGYISYAVFCLKKKNTMHARRQNLFQELDAIIHLFMEAKHLALSKSITATSLNT